MDVLTAHTPRGFLHAVTCDWPEGMNHGEAFRRIQERQGCTVRRYAMDEYLALRATAHVTPTVSPRTEAVPALAPEPAGRDPDPLPETRPPWEAEPELLAIGAAIVHPVIGYATVTHHQGEAGRQVAVARGPRGEALVNADWRGAGPHDVPMWLRVADVATDPVDVQVEVRAPIVPPLPPRAGMLSLWDAL